MIPSILLPRKIPLSHGFNEKSARSWSSRKSICMSLKTDSNSVRQMKELFSISLPSCRSVYSSWNVHRSVSTAVFSAFYPQFVLCYQCFPYMSPACSTLCRKKDSFKIQPGLLDCLSTQGFTISFSFQTLIPTSNITLKWSVKPQTGVWMDVEKRELDKKLSVLQYVISLTV